MPTSDEIETLRRRLQNWEWWPPNTDLNEFVALGPIGTRLLTEEFTRRSGYGQVLIAAALGRSQGTQGIDELREAVRASGRGLSDLRCASLFALTRRCHEKASGDLADALLDRDPSLKSYAILGLAAYGDDRAWEAAYLRLLTLFRRPKRIESIPPDEVLAVCYLGIHASNAARVRRLGQALCEYWEKLNPEIRTHIQKLWPEVCDLKADISDLRPPNGQRMRKWVLGLPLFSL